MQCQVYIYDETENQCGKRIDWEQIIISYVHNHIISKISFLAHISGCIGRMKTKDVLSNQDKIIYTEVTTLALEIGTLPIEKLDEWCARILGKFIFI